MTDDVPTRQNSQAPRKPDLILLRDPAERPPLLVDSFQRRITYLRLSVTDRCDLRCEYCMPERMTFLPKKEVLTLEELYDLATGFIARGVTKIRITGGEPLVRRDIIDLFTALGRRLGHDLAELTLTTNGTQLAEHAEALARAGVKRVNVSLDTLDRARFAKLTRHRRGQGGGSQGQIERGGAQGRQRRGTARSHCLGPCRGPRRDADRGDAAGRCRG
jgi:cyclic pyranopterin phosphate synthase